MAAAGTGPAVVCVHGIPGSWRQAMPLAEDLADRFHVVLPSRPGYGATPLRVGRTYDEQADAYAALLDALGIDRCAIVGISGGGPSATAFAARHPDRTDALVLVCALAAHLMDAPRVMTLLRVPGVAEALTPAIRAVARRRVRRRASVESYMERTLTSDELERTQSDAGVRADLVRHMLGHQSAPPGTAGLRNDYLQLQRASAFDYELTCPTLVLHSDADTVVPLDHARFHAEALDANLTVFENAGHLFLVTRRAEASEAVGSFVAGAVRG